MQENRKSTLQNSELPLDIFSMLRMMVANWWMILTAGLIGAMIAYMMVGSAYTPSYTSNMTFIVSAKGATNSLLDLTAANEMAETFSEVLNSRLLKKKVQQELKLDYLPGEIATTVVEGTNLMTLSVNAPSPEHAFKIMKSVLNNYSEITDHVQSKVEEYQKQWKNDVLFPSVEYCAKQIFESEEGQLSELFKAIDHFKTDVSGVDCTTEDVPAWERVAGALVGTFVGGIGLGASGCINGLSKDLAKTAAFEFGAIALLGFLNLLNPVTLIAVIAGTIFLGWKSGSDKVIQKAKKQISDAMVAQICSPANMQADQLSDSITAKLHEVKSMMSTAVDKEIESAEEQVKTIIKDMKKGQDEIDRRKSIIDKCEQKIQSLDIALNELIISLVN